MYWDHTINLVNTGTKAVVLDRVYVTGVQGVPTPVIKTATVGTDRLQPEAVIKAVQGTAPGVKGYRVPPNRSARQLPYLVLGLDLPACATTGHKPPEYAYGQYYLVFYHVAGESTKYLAPFPVQDILCGRGAPAGCLHKDPSDWASH